MVLPYWAEAQAPDPSCHLQVRRSCLGSATNYTAPSLAGAQGAFPLTIHGVHSLPPRSETQGWPP